VAAARINVAHRASIGALRASLRHALDAGRLLLAAKAALPHGSWRPWLAAHVECSERTAQLYMRLARDRDAVERAKLVVLAALNSVCEAVRARQEEHDLLYEGRS